DRRHQLAADVVHQRVEIVIAADGVVRDVDAAVVVRDAVRAHRVELGLHRGVRRRRHDAEFDAEAEPDDHAGSFALRARPRAKAAAVRREAIFSSPGMISSQVMRSAYFWPMSKRFASCGPSARSPTQSVTTTLRKL